MRFGRRTALAAALGLIALLLSASSAPAAATRAEYVTETDAICAAADREFKDLARRSKKSFAKLGKIGPEAGKKAFSKLFRRIAKETERANGIFERMLHDVEAVAPAPGDEYQVGNWITGLRDYAELNDDSARALRRGAFNKSLAYGFLAIEALSKAADWVDGYGFEHCPGGAVVKNLT
jgi:hypothetical protein